MDFHDNGSLRSAPTVSHTTLSNPILSLPCFMCLSLLLLEQCSPLGQMASTVKHFAPILECVNMKKIVPTCAERWIKRFARFSGLQLLFNCLGYFSLRYQYLGKYNWIGLGIGIERYLMFKDLLYWAWGQRNVIRMSTLNRISWPKSNFVH